MSRSIHTTFKALKGLTVKELNDQFVDPDSDLAILAYKIGIKKDVVKKRKQKAINIIHPTSHI